MKHPLTSKERRGLVAVAAAALLCIGSGFIFRNCSSRHSASVVVVDYDSVGDSAVADSIAMDSVSERSGKSERSRRSKKTDLSDKSDKSDKSERRKKSKKVRQEKTYPTRSPLDEPCD